MAFRRQDIPKTTRKSDDGSPRRIYPRYLRDRAIVPKIALLIDYLDRMVGHKRGELAPDTVLEYFGDPKLARCLLSCLSEHYVYRAPEFADVVGEEAAAALSKWEIVTPASLRGYLYQSANESLGGFVASRERETFLAESGEVLGLSAAQLDELIHLDAERNAILIRIGPRPSAEDVVARYNVLLTLSVLRHASSVTLDLPGMPLETISAVCARHDVSFTAAATGHIRVAGRQSSAGTWSGFGARLARCALHLLMLSLQQPTGEARVHFGDRAYRFVIDAKCTSFLRPKLGAAAGIGAMVNAAAFADQLAQHRRETDDFSGWRVRRMPDPVVVDGAVLLPELAFSYGQVTVSAIPVPTGQDGAHVLAALRQVNRVRPTIALGATAILAGVPSASLDDPEDLAMLLAEIAEAAESAPKALDRIQQELTEHGWLSTQRLTELFSGRNDLESAVVPFVSQGAVFIPQFGLCGEHLIDELRADLAGGPVEIAALRRSVADRVGAVSGIDALTLHVLTNSSVMMTPQPVDWERDAA